ncbi:unnamed protein product, partial [Prorocentrum cordatum]
PSAARTATGSTGTSGSLPCCAKDGSRSSPWLSRACGARGWPASTRGWALAAVCPTSGPCPGESAWTPGASPCRLPSQAPGRDGPPRRRPPPPRAARRGAARHARQPPCESQELSQSPPGSLLEACSGHLGSSERSASRRRHAGAAKGGQLVNRRTASAGRTPAAAGRGGGLVPPQPVTTKDTCGAESSSAVRPNRPSAAESPTGGGALPQLACSGACRSVVAFQA